ncbi:DUF1561 family protein, partial [Leptospira interrogans]
MPTSPNSNYNYLPGNISILTSIAWDLGSNRYFIRSGGSD